jgi:putative thioredoxin
LSQPNEQINLPDSPGKEKFINAISAIKEGKLENALENLIETIMIEKGELRELARKTVLGLFDVLSNQHPVTKKYRRRFDMALY